MNESCRTYEWVTSHVWWVPSHICLCHGLHLWMRHTYEWVTYMHESRMKQTATCCNILQRMAAHFRIVQHTATQCSTVQHSTTQCNIVNESQVTLQHTAAHCNTLQHTATTHCNTLFSWSPSLVFESLLGFRYLGIRYLGFRYLRVSSAADSSVGSSSSQWINNTSCLMSHTNTAIYCNTLQHTLPWTRW